jgi:hypothetical protein
VFHKFISLGYLDKYIFRNPEYALLRRLKLVLDIMCDDVNKPYNTFNNFTSQWNVHCSLVLALAIIFHSEFQHHFVVLMRQNVTMPHK